MLFLSNISQGHQRATNQLPLTRKSIEKQVMGKHSHQPLNNMQQLIPLQ
jgi:hypothetical protein